MGGPVQISAFISEDTRALLDAVTEARGLKKGWVVEEALVHYLSAVRELPADVIIPSRMVLTAESAREVASLILEPRAPTDAMRALTAGEDGEDVPR